MKTFSFKDRQNNLEQFASKVFDIVIIGGGINGAGIARDAASRGMSVALVEASDFASGTSSRSSKLIHGGIRYLENREFHLVYEALRERNKLFTIAPHLVHHLRFLIPIYQKSRVGMFKMGLGMWLYDALALFQTPERHLRLSKSEAIAKYPLLQQQELQGAYLYSDAYMDDDRLVFETLRSAAQYGAQAVNYVKAVSAVFDEAKKVKAIEIEDQLTGKKSLLRGRHFISTVGPWTDLVASSLFKNWQSVLRPTKGVHLTFAKERFPLSSAVVMAVEERITFAIPRHDMVIIGTTDTDFSGDPNTVKASSADVNYLLNVAEKYFPGAKLKKEDVLASYAGVRPLVKDQAESEGKTSREHWIFSEKYAVTFVAGGKYTTYRLIAEQAMQEVLKYFPEKDQLRFAHNQTHLPLNPIVNANYFANQEGLQRAVLQTSKISQADAQIFVQRHGDEALEIIRRYGKDLQYIEYEALHAIENTMCLNLLDFIARRTPLFLAEKDHGHQHLEILAKLFMNALSIGEEEVRNQIKKFELYCQHELQWMTNN